MTGSERTLEERLRETQTLLAVSQAVGTTLDLTETLRRVARETVRALGADMGGAYVADPGGIALRPVAGYRVPKPLLEAIRQSPIPLRGHRFLEEAWEGRRPVWSSDAATDPRLDRETRQRFPYRSILFVPMEAKGEPIGGFFVVWWAEAHPVTPEELRLVEGISRQAALAIDNAQLYVETEQRQHEAEVLAELASSITASLDLDTVLERVAKGARELCGSDMAKIALRDPRAATMSLRYLVGARYQGYETFRIEAGKGSGGLVIATGRPFRTDHYAGDPRISKDYLEVARVEGIVTELVVPIQIEGTVEGLLFVQNRTPRPFTDRDEAILLRLASHAAIAIQNARLFGELRAALEAVEASQQRVVQAERLRALGEMAGGIAHDFNNALAAILGRAQLLLGRVEDPNLRRQLQVIEKVALEVGQTVRRIQEFTRTRRVRPFQAVDLARVVEEAAEFTRARWADEAQAKGITYEVRVEGGPVPPVAGDPDELREALTNLVLNALDAMPEGGRLTIRTGVEGERVSCVVADTGIGMPEEVRRRVFDPFFTTKGPRGSGLGLSMVYGIITRHGGEIEVRSQPGQGSAFTLRLPLAREIAAVPEAPEAAAPARPPRSARVLVIDDEAEIRDLLVELLTGQGHVAVGCADGRSGLTRFEAERFDLVITDLGMPGLSGWEVAQAVKGLRREIPVALVTGWGDRIDPEEARAQGVDHLVAKPFRIEEITALVARAVSDGSPRERPASNP